MLEVGMNTDTHLSEAERQELVGSLPFIEADAISAQRMQMAIAVEQSAALADLAPLVLVNKTNRPFIFGDAPVVFYNGFYRDVRLRGVLGMDTPGLMVFFPLSASTCLTLIDPERYQVRGVRDGRVSVRNLQDVLALNKLQLHASSNCGYFGDSAFAPYVTEAWKQEQHRLTKHDGMVVQAPGRDATTGESMGDIVHGYLPQLNYRLRLSFISHETRGDEGYSANSRNGARTRR